MLLKKNSKPQIDYMQNWPEHYYEIENAATKRDCLKQAIDQQLDPQYDIYRKKLLEKRFFSNHKKGDVDAFMHAWMMIKASSAMQVSFFQKKRARRELESYMEELCLLHYTPESAEENQVLIDEWSDFARQYIFSCTGSRAYCSTLFGFVPISDTTVARKIVEEIQQVTQTYPAIFEYADAFLPFRQIMHDTFCQMIENGNSYWEM